MTVEETGAALERVERGLPPTDGVKWFAWLYADVTRAIAALFDGGQLETPRFMSDLVTRFGSAFLAAVADPAAAAPAWRPLFDRRHDSRVAPLQFAIAGLNAHVGAELPAGLVDEAARLGIDLPNADAEHRDWNRINATIAAVEPKAKHYLLTGAVKQLDRVFKGVDDVAATWSVEAAREAAWAHGRALWGLRDEPFMLDPYLAALERTTGMVCRLLLVPTAVD